MAPHTLLSLAFVSVVYFVATVNSFPSIQHLESMREDEIDHVKEHHFVENIEHIVPEFKGYIIRNVSLSEFRIFSGIFYFLKLYRSMKHDNSGTIEECYVAIWQRPVIQNLVVFILQCQPVDSNLQIEGFQDWHIDVPNPKNKAAAEFGMVAINRKTNCFYMSLITKILNVIKIHTHEWIHYTIDVLIIKTVCTNEEVNLYKHLKQCPPKKDAHKKKCQIVVKSLTKKTSVYELVYDTCS